MAERAESPSPHEHILDDAWHDVGVRRAPRAGRFLLVGIAGGAAVAVVMTVIAESSGLGAANFGLEGAFRIFAINALIFVAIGLALAGGAVIVLERLANRRGHKTLADRETVLYHDLSRPVQDDPPKRRE